MKIVPLSRIVLYSHTGCKLHNFRGNIVIDNVNEPPLTCAVCNGALDFCSAVTLLSNLCHCEILESRIKRRSHEISERGKRLHVKISDFSTILKAGTSW